MVRDRLGERALCDSVVCVCGSLCVCVNTLRVKELCACDKVVCKGLCVKELCA